MMITHPTLSKEIFLWRLQLLWTLVLTLDMCLFYHLQLHCGEFQVPAQMVWKALQCRLFTCRNSG